ncbi:MAG: ubiquinone anaerobic biosynthesis accessory factor UbiT [Acidithiobacillus sp.]
MNHLLGERSGDLAPLEGRRLTIEGTDVGKRLHFLVAGGKLRRSSTAMTDLRIRGTLADLLRLGLRLEDPDTLFFNRRLSLEGDMVTGLYVKNLLDGLDLDWAAVGQRLLGPVAGPVVAQGLHRSGVAALLRDRLERVLRLP